MYPFRIERVDGFEEDAIRLEEDHVELDAAMARVNARAPAEAGWMISEGDVRRIALGLPGSYEQACYGGRPSWRTKPRMFTWIREDPEALVLWVESVEEKEALIESEPEKFFTTPHYDGDSIVLVRLDAVEADEATEMITESWRLRAPSSLVKAWDARRG